MAKIVYSKFYSVLIICENVFAYVHIHLCKYANSRFSLDL